MQLTVCIAGATGWTGEALVRGVREADDLKLRSAVSRSAAGGEIDGAPVYANAAEALEGVDVLVDYTSVEAVKANALAAIEAGVAVVIGTSGLTADDFEDIDAAARERLVGVVASANFSLTAAMASAAALLAARHLPNWEVIDYASATKPDVPSGTARELAERLGEARLGRPRRGGSSAAHRGGRTRPRSRPRSSAAAPSGPGCRRRSRRAPRPARGSRPAGGPAAPPPAARRARARCRSGRRASSRSRSR